MIKRFPSRNHRSKGIKVKHVLQIILLLGVCFWLIYQVKHNHDKKKEFDKKDTKLPVSKQTDQILKLGRRDLHPGKNEESRNEKHEEEEEDEHIEEDEENKHDHEEQEDVNKHETEEHEDNKHEGREQGGEENKHGAEEQEEDENKNEDVEDEGREGRGGGDDEIDENDQVKSEVDTTDRDDEFLDEEKEKEEEVGEKENENEDEEKDGLVENHNNHEAREENYKGDDASSAVAHDTHATNTETETLGLENSDVNAEMNITKPENEFTYSDESVRKQNDSDLKVSEGNVIDGISSNATAEETGNNILSNPVDDSSYLNKTATTNSYSHLESSSNLTVVTTEASNNVTRTGNDTSSSSEQNKTVTLSESDQAQNTTTNTTIPGDVKNVQTEGLEQSGNRISEENLLNIDSMVSVKTENGGAAIGESSNLVASNVTENTSINERSESDISESDKFRGNTETNETQNVDVTEDEIFKRDTQTGETDETSDSSSANETLDSAEQDAIDSSDTHTHEDVTDGRTDLDTLPEIRNEGDDSDETVADFLEC
ncbi:hypothetical protein CR513_27989, partial [Mucuna pruriens]